MRTFRRTRILVPAALLVAGLLPLAPAQAAPANDYGTISGQVTRTVDGSGVAAAKVAVTDSITDAYLETVTAGADGTFTVGPLAPGQYRLVPIAGGLVATGAGYRSVLVPPKTDVTGVAVYVDPATSITGLVRTSDGMPVSGARVYALAKSRLDAVATASQDFGWTYAALDLLNSAAFAGVSATGWHSPAPGLDFTGADGTFALDGLVPGTYIVRVSVPGRGVPLDRTVVLTRASQRIVVTLPSGASVSGRVTYPNGAGAAGVPIALRVGLDNTFPNLPPSITTTTDAQGNYTITGLAPGFYSFQNLDGWSSADTGSTVTITKKTTALRQDIALSGQSRLEGTITDEFGSPLAGIGVEADFANSPGVVTTTTDSAGHYVFAGLGADTYNLYALTPGYSELAGDLTYPLTGALTTTTADVALQRANWIFGTVVDPSGHPVPGADVRSVTDPTYYAPLVTDTDGSFVVVTNASGTSLSAEAPHYGASAAYQVPSLGTDLTVQLGLQPLSTAHVPSAPSATAVGGLQSITVSGTVGPDGGNPVTNFYAVASPGGHYCSLHFSCTITGLKDNATYTVKVYATNELGNGLAQLLKVKTKPTDMPRHILSHRGPRGAAVIVFKAPKSTIKIVNYRLRYKVNGKWRIYYHRKWTKSPVTVRGLRPQTTYVGTLEALLAKGKATRSGIFYFTTG